MIRDLVTETIKAEKGIILNSIEDIDYYFGLDSADEHYEEAPVHLPYLEKKGIDTLSENNAY